MEKIAVFQINADVVAEPSGFEKEKVTGEKMGKRDSPAVAPQLFGCSRQLNGKEILIDKVDQS